MKCQNLFAGNNKKSISICRLLKILPRLPNIKDYNYTFKKNNSNMEIVASLLMEHGGVLLL